MNNLSQQDYNQNIYHDLIEKFAYHASFCKDHEIPIFVNSYLSDPNYFFLNDPNWMQYVNSRIYYYKYNQVYGTIGNQINPVNFMHPQEQQVTQEINIIEKKRRTKFDLGEENSIKQMF
jgi:hypothetical protein